MPTQPLLSVLVTSSAPIYDVHDPVCTLDINGVRFMHFGQTTGDAAALQGVMRMAVPDQIELEYVQQMMMWMLFPDDLSLFAGHIVQLGLGTAALTKCCYRQFPEARVSAIELNPHVIAACHDHFKLPPNDARLNVQCMDALEFVMNPANHASIAILQVDLYDAKAHGPVFSSSEFYQACADCLTEDGMMTVNLFYDGENDGTHTAHNLQGLQAAFDAVVWLPEVHDANVVALAFKRAPAIDFAALYVRAAEIRDATKLPAPYWVNGLQEWMAGG
jgi:spermidine synthase